MGSCEVIDLCDEQTNITMPSQSTQQQQQQNGYFVINHANPFVVDSVLKTPPSMPSGLNLSNLPKLDLPSSSELNDDKKVNIMSKHVGLFESLLTPKQSANSIVNSAVMQLEKEREQKAKIEKENALFDQMKNDLDQSALQSAEIGKDEESKQEMSMAVETKEEEFGGNNLWNVSPPNPSTFGMDNSFENMDNFNLNDDLYLGNAMPFRRSPDFETSAFYGNNSPIMPSSYS